MVRNLHEVATGQIAIDLRRSPVVDLEAVYRGLSVYVGAIYTSDSIASVLRDIVQMLLLVGSDDSLVPEALQPLPSQGDHLLICEGP